MKHPLQITFRNLDHSDAIEALIRKRADELEKYFDRIISCHVVVESEHHHHHKGRLYHLRIELGLPGTELIVNRDPAAKHTHEDIHIAVRDAFDAARRQLADQVSRMRGDVKTHEKAVGRDAE